MTASMGGRVAVLVSGSGTNLQALLDDPTIRPHIALVLSDRPGVFALQRAAEADVEALVIEPTGDRADLSNAVADALTERGIDVIASAGYMRVLGHAGRRTLAEPLAERPPRVAARRSRACTGCAMPSPTASRSPG